MIHVDANELWRQIPPEEKLEIMARAQSKGILAGAVLILIGCTLAVGLHFEPLMWGAILVSPLIFQFAAGKAWRDLKPSVMLEYLAARSAARRYAFANQSKDLGLILIFRAHCEELFGDDRLNEALEAMAGDRAHMDVWVALFNDCVVLMTERLGGAELILAALANDRLTVSAESPESGQEYAPDREVTLTAKSRTGHIRRIKLRSRYPGALVVFERKLRAAIISGGKAAEERLALSDADFDDDKLFSVNR